MPPKILKREIRVYEGYTFEIIPLDTFVSSSLCGTTSELLATRITVEDDEHEDRVAQAKHARSFVKKPFGKSKRVPS